MGWIIPWALIESASSCSFQDQYLYVVDIYPVANIQLADFAVGFVAYLLSPKHHPIKHPTLDLILVFVLTLNFSQWVN